MKCKALYSQVTGLGNLSGAKPDNFSVGMDDDEVDFDDLSQAFQKRAFDARVSNK